MAEAVKLVTDENSFAIRLNGKEVIKHSTENPFLYIGKGTESVDMYRGNFQIDDYVTERTPLKLVSVEKTEAGLDASFSDGHEEVLTLQVLKKEDRVQITFNCKRNHNRIWVRLQSSAEEKVYGGGEQLSYFNMKGQNFPLWTSEPGVGRNKNTYTTWQADVKDKAGGDYYNTNYPQPTFVSSDKYIAHMNTIAYADFDFSNDDFHELHCWEIPESIELIAGDTYAELLRKIKERFGTQPELPDWTYNGIWLGIQGGTDVVERKLQKAERHGIKVGGVWCQDWQGKRVTSFGKRLMWNWIWNEEMYPGLDKKIWEWKEKGIRFLGYINPYVAVEGHLFKEAEEQNYLAKQKDGSTYVVDFGEFYCGVVDFTNPEATEWYKTVIKENLIDFGLDGWMADFGEYLPTDVVLHNEASAMKEHNAWPVRWGEVNRDAIHEAGKQDEIVYFMRAGYTGIQEACPLLWGGDQSVIWEKDDGLASVIPAALSSGMSGCGLHHSDIGGYTSLHGNKREKELLLRWVEMAAFTPVMRTHEGNRPDDCFQFDGDEETLDFFGAFTSIYTHLKPYIKSLVKENTEAGLPVQRPLFVHYEEDETAHDIQYQYLFGKDMLVAPVIDKEAETREVYLPEDNWVHVWSEKEFRGGWITVSAPLGEPPVFYRRGSEHEELFQQIAQVKMNGGRSDA
ncbi:alpha-glucosidase [Bacillus daqingensis]|uniref:Alpha-glucosidase n=1 Tax=Bacillus daqingensis TaxID=872396 RepID=A0ABV9NX43_9BACI